MTTMTMMTIATTTAIIHDTRPCGRPRPRRSHGRDRLSVIWPMVAWTKAELQADQLVIEWLSRRASSKTKKAFRLVCDLAMEGCREAVSQSVVGKHPCRRRHLHLTHMRMRLREQSPATLRGGLRSTFALRAWVLTASMSRRSATPASATPAT